MKIRFRERKSVARVKYFDYTDVAKPLFYVENIAADFLIERMSPRRNTALIAGNGLQAKGNRIYVFVCCRKYGIINALIMMPSKKNRHVLWEDRQNDSAEDSIYLFSLRSSADFDQSFFWQTGR